MMSRYNNINKLNRAKTHFLISTEDSFLNDDNHRTKTMQYTFVLYTNYIHNAHAINVSNGD